MTVTQPAAQPVQVRLPGQAAAPDGPLDLTMMFVVHRAFRRDLENFAAAAARTPVDDRAAWAALHERWQLFAEGLHHHHSVEDDRLWPALDSAARAAGEDEAPEVLAAMAAEHSTIDPLLEAVGEGFRRLAAVPDDDARAALAVRTAAARAQLGHHLAHEETEALALAQRVLAPAEWNSSTARRGASRAPSGSAASAASRSSRISSGSERRSSGPVPGRACPSTWRACSTPSRACSATARPVGTRGQPPPPDRACQPAS